MSPWYCAQESTGMELPVVAWTWQRHWTESTQLSNLSRAKQASSERELASMGMARQSVVSTAHRVHGSIRGQDDFGHCRRIFKVHWCAYHDVFNHSADHPAIALQQTFSTHGLPCTIVSDNGSPFTSLEFRQYCSMNGIKHIRSSPFHPATNGLAERAVQTIKRGWRRWEEISKQGCSNYWDAIASLHIRQQANRQHRCWCQRHRDSGLICFFLGENRVLQQQEKAQESRNPAVPEHMFYVGDTVWAMIFAAAAPKWLPGVLQHCLGPVSPTVGLTDRRLWRRHTDHIRARLPEENVTTTSPRPPEGTCCSTCESCPTCESCSTCERGYRRSCDGEITTRSVIEGLCNRQCCTEFNDKSSCRSGTSQIDKIRATDH